MPTFSICRFKGLKAQSCSCRFIEKWSNKLGDFIHQQILKLPKKIQSKLNFREEVFPDYTLLGIHKKKKMFESFERYQNIENISNDLITGLVNILKCAPSSSDATSRDISNQLCYVTIKHKNEPQSTLYEKDLTKIFGFISDNRANATDEIEQDLMTNIKIKKIFLCNKSVVIECNDEFTQRWLSSLNLDSIESSNYKISNDDMIPCSIRVLTRPKFYSLNEFRNQLVRGNPEIQIKSVIFYGSKRVNNIESIMYFGIDKSAYESLRAKDFKILFDCTQTHIHSWANHNDDATFDCMLQNYRGLTCTSDNRKSY